MIYFCIAIHRRFHKWATIIAYMRIHRAKVTALTLALMRSLHTRAHIRWKIITKIDYQIIGWRLLSAVHHNIVYFITHDLMRLTMSWLMSLFINLSCFSCNYFKFKLQVKPQVKGKAQVPWTWMMQMVLSFMSSYIYFIFICLVSLTSVYINPSLWLVNWFTSLWREVSQRGSPPLKVNVKIFQLPRQIMRNFQILIIALNLKVIAKIVTLLLKNWTYSTNPIMPMRFFQSSPLLQRWLVSVHWEDQPPAISDQVNHNFSCL